MLSRKARLLGVKANLLKHSELKEQKLQLKVDKKVKPGTERDIRVHAALPSLIPGKRIPVGNGCKYRVRVREPKIRAEKVNSPSRFYALCDSGIHTLGHIAILSTAAKTLIFASLLLSPTLNRWHFRLFPKILWVCDAR